MLDKLEFLNLSSWILSDCMLCFCVRLAKLGLWVWFVWKSSFFLNLERTFYGEKAKLLNFNLYLS